MRPFAPITDEVSSRSPGRPITSEGIHFLLVNAMGYGAGFLSYWFSRLVKGRESAPSVPGQPVGPGQVGASNGDPKPLPIDRLRALAEKHRPPQSWYDESVNPFEPTKK
jgi:hypothetical protein